MFSEVIFCAGKDKEGAAVGSYRVRGVGRLKGRRRGRRERGKRKGGKRQRRGEEKRDYLTSGTCGCRKRPISGQIGHKFGQINHSRTLAKLFPSLSSLCATYFLSNDHLRCKFSGGRVT